MTDDDDDGAVAVWGSFFVVLAVTFSSGENFTNLQYGKDLMKDPLPPLLFSFHFQPNTQQRT